MQGLYKAFGESDLGTVLEIWLAYSGAELTALRRQEPPRRYIAELQALGGPEMAGLNPLQSQRYAKLKQERRRVVQRIDSHYAFDDLRRSTLAGQPLTLLRVLSPKWCSDAWDSITCAELAHRSQSMDGPMNTWILESDSVLQVVVRDDTQREFSTSLTGERGALMKLTFRRVTISVG